MTARDDLRPNRDRERRVRLTVAEAAAELRVSRMTVYRLIHAGDLPAMRVGRSLRIDADDLDAYVRCATTGEAL